MIFSFFLIIGLTWPSIRGTRPQAWTLRRALSLFNAIVGKPHWPREVAIQEMIKTLNIEQPAKEGADSEGSEADDIGEEDMESELETDDEEVPVALRSGGLCLLV